MTTARETILIVDDVPENLMLLENILSDEYVVKEASCGADALFIANTHPHPDMILLDVMMPDMDGHQVCKALKTNPQTAAIPVIFVTGMGDVEDEQLGFELGAVDYILKPYSIPAVLARVSSHLALHGKNQQLEHKYQQKNIELIDKNVQLMKEIYEREQLEITLRRSQEDLRQLNSYIQTVREDEKATIAREIHDELGGTLTALKFDTAWVGKKIPEGHQPLIDKVNDMARLVDGSVATIRRIVTELRPTVLDDLGLWAAIEWQVEEFKKRVGIECKVDINIDCQQFELDKHQSISLFRIIQESLTNVVRHASATKIEVGARCYSNIVRLWIRDNGAGLTQNIDVHNNSHGIRGMHERIESLGGSIELDSNEGEGTTVNIVLPINQTDNHE